MSKKIIDGWGWKFIRWTEEFIGLKMNKPIKLVELDIDEEKKDE